MYRDSCCSWQIGLVTRKCAWPYKPAGQNEIIFLRQAWTDVVWSDIFTFSMHTKWIEDKGEGQCIEKLGHKSKVYLLEIGFLMVTYTNKWAPSWENLLYPYANNNGADQPEHPRSLIRVLAVRMKRAWVLSYSLNAQWRLISLDGCPGWSESEHSHFVYFVMRQLVYKINRGYSLMSDY